MFHDDDIGAFTITEFSDRFRIGRSRTYEEVKAGRLRIAHVGGRSLITRSEARRYQAMLDAEAVQSDKPRSEVA